MCLRVITFSSNLSCLRNEATTFRKPPRVSAGEAWGRKSKIYAAGKSDRALPTFAEPAAKQAGDERHEANCKEVHDCEVA